MRIVTGLVVAFLLPLVASAQGGRPSGTPPKGTTYYPTEIYPGENIITVTNPAGIETIRARSSAGLRVTVPTIRGCPTSVDVRVVATNPEADELLSFTTYDCTGDFTESSRNLFALDKWTILQTRIGPVAVGAATCADAQVSLVSDETKTVDSIVSDDPAIRIEMPPKIGGTWMARTGRPLAYQICYRPTEAGSRSTRLRIYIRRRQPHKGLNDSLSEKPVSTVAYVPPPPPEPEIVEAAVPTVPPIVDPTTFRNILMPTAETLPKGRIFVGNYDIAGWLGGYGITDDLMVMGGGAFIPEFIQKVTVVTIGAKFRALTVGPFEASVGAQYGYTSSTTDISAFAPYGVVSLGNRAYRVSLAAGYTWKRHTSELNSFDENASIVTLGGDVTVKRGWKFAAETYFIEKSGLRPIALTSRWFTDRLAFDLGILIDLEGTGGVEGTGTLSGKIKEIRAAPLLSLVMVF